MFLDDPNLPFNLSNAFCRSRGIHVNSRDVVTYFLKFVIHLDDLNTKTHTCTYIDNSLEEVTKFGCRLTFWGMLNGD